MTPTNATVIDHLAPQWRPAVPAGDNRHETSAVINQVPVRSPAFTAELHAIASRHLDDAPASCGHISELIAILSQSILAWIEERPQ
jgi:hypothetical protein